jgi:N-acetylmuramoyl-L-alanine amidase
LLLLTSPAHAVPQYKPGLLELAALIEAEAGGEPLIGKVGVGAVVLNRTKDPRWPSTVPAVVDQRRPSPQFANRHGVRPSPDSLWAAELALEGIDPTRGALFFYNPRTATDGWIRTRPVTVRIANHVFAR